MESCSSVSEITVGQTSDVVKPPHCSARQVHIKSFGWIHILEVPAFRGTRPYSGLFLSGMI